MSPGTLFLVAVPIGNLGDLTRRAAEVFAEVTLVASEEVSATRRLLSHLGLSVRVVSYREAGRAEAGAALLRALEGGESVALVSEAGTPGISDPGRELVERCHEGGIPVCPVPGPSALSAALSVCGLPVRRIAFEGFLPRSGPARQALLEELAREPRSVVLFEAPHRLTRTLEDLRERLGERRAFLGRELTKVFEECRLSTLTGLLERFSQEAPRGECVLVVEGATSEAAPSGWEPWLQDAGFLRDLGLSARDAVEVLARFREAPRREAYRAFLEAGQDSAS